MVDNSSYQSKISCDTNYVSEPRKLDDLDAKFWWLLWDYLIEQGFGKNSVTSPNISEWLIQQKDEFTLYHLKETKEDD